MLSKITLRNLSSTLLFSLLVSLPSLLVFGQGQRQRDPADDAAACAACGGIVGIPILILTAIFVINIALLIWVARDAKSRGMDSAVLWMVLVMLTSVIGLIIYIFARPQGNLVQCPHCNNRRLAASAKCPHCGNA